MHLQAGHRLTKPGGTPSLFDSQFDSEDPCKSKKSHTKIMESRVVECFKIPSPLSNFQSGNGAMDSKRNISDDQLLQNSKLFNQL